MNTIRNTRRVATAVLLLSTLGISPAQAWDQSRVGQPGTFETIMSYKMPGVYGPKLPQPPEDPNRHYPVPGSAEALARAKTPWMFPTSATDTGPICPNAYLYPPGSGKAIANAKMPGTYGPRTCK